MSAGVYPRKPLSERLMGKVKKTSHCWEWQGAIGTNGYGRIGHKDKILQAHRASWELHVGPIPEDQWVLHRCDNRVCVRPDHLFLGDRKMNIADCVSKKRHTFGERSSLSKLSAKQVLEIRVMAGSASQRAIAKMFGTTQSNVSRILSGYSWPKEST